jgi:hypothetical protein
LPEEYQAQARKQLAAVGRRKNVEHSTLNVECRSGQKETEAWTGTEKELQWAVERLLRIAGWKWFHMPGASAIGNPCGWPDLIAFGPRGRVALIELKTARGVVSDRQAVLFEALRALGHTVHVCRSVAQVSRLIKEQL